MPEETRSARHGIVTFQFQQSSQISISSVFWSFTGWTCTWWRQTAVPGVQGTRWWSRRWTSGWRRRWWSSKAGWQAVTFSSAKEDSEAAKDSGDDRRITSANYRRISAIQGINRAVAHNQCPDFRQGMGKTGIGNAGRKSGTRSGSLSFRNDDHA